MDIDLHIHSTASDGTCTPGEIIRLAQVLALGAIAITDHDTVDGVREALTRGIPPTLGFITGVEISTAAPPEIPVDGSLHILGYGFDVDDPALGEALGRLQEARKRRTPRIIERLRALGFDLTVDRMTAEFGNGPLGRPHVARLMIDQGIVGSVDEAFNEYLGRGGPAYVEKYRIPAAEAIRVIRGAGGIAVLAHPGVVNLPPDRSAADLVARLAEMGLGGIEAHYPAHRPDQIATYTALADQYGLRITGGTDFHGTITPDIMMGCGRGDFHVPYQLYENLLQAA